MHRSLARAVGVGTLLLALIPATLLAVTPRAELPRLLDEAERIRKDDKARSRALLDEVQRSLAAAPDPLLIARAQLLECGWADAPPAAYRAVSVGLDAAAKAGDARMQSKLLQ